MFSAALVIMNENSDGKQVEMEAPKTLQQGCSTPLVAALDPSIKGKNLFYSKMFLHLLTRSRTFGRVSSRLRT